MQRCAADGLTFIGMRRACSSRRSSAAARPCGVPAIPAPSRSARYSICRLIAICTSMAASGAKISMAIEASMLRSRPPKKNEMRASMVIAPAIVAATVPVSMSRFLMCASSWAVTPSSSSLLSAPRMP